MNKIITLMKNAHEHTIAVAVITACDTGSSGSNDGTIEVTGVSLNKNMTSIFAGNSEKLTTTISPLNSTNQNLKWSSSDDSIAMVSKYNRAIY